MTIFGPIVPLVTGRAGNQVGLSMKTGCRITKVKDDVQEKEID